MIHAVENVKPKIAIYNGPNLNLLGQREPHIYGHQTLLDIEAHCQRIADTYGYAIDFRQTNHEGEMITWLHNLIDETSYLGLILNGGAWTHTSVALYDALSALKLPILEVHLSNPSAREPFRHHSYISLKAMGVISGLGAMSYTLAVEALNQLQYQKDKSKIAS